jgi:hypothetical protein
MWYTFSVIPQLIIPQVVIPQLIILQLVQHSMTTYSPVLNLKQAPGMQWCNHASILEISSCASCRSRFKEDGSGETSCTQQKLSKSEGELKSGCWHVKGRCEDKKSKLGTWESFLPPLTLSVTNLELMSSLMAAIFIPNSLPNYQLP